MKTVSIRSVNLLYLVSMLLVISLGAYLQSLSFSWGLILTEILLILGPALLFLRLDRQPEKLRLPFKRIPVLLGLACLTGGMGLWLFDSMLEAILIGITGFSPSGGLDSLPSTPVEGLLVFLGFAIAAPICEEILFRGVIQTRYMQHYRPFIAITIPALLFAFFHLRLVGLPALIPVAFFITVVFWRTGSLIASILVHFGNNLISALILVASGLSIPVPIPLPSIPAALIGLVIIIISLFFILRTTRSPEAVPTRLAAIRLASFWPLLLAGVVYMVAAGFEAASALSGASPRLSAGIWKDPVELHYVVEHKGNELVGQAVCRIMTQDDLTLLHCQRDTEPFEIRIGNSFYSGGKVTFVLEAVWDADMHLVQLEAGEQFEQGRHEWVVTQKADELEIKVSPFQQESETLAFEADTFIEEEWPWRLSAMRFNPGLYKSNLLLPLMWREVQKSSGPVVTDLRLALTGEESVSVPAGEFTVWHVTAFNGESAWYDVEAPHNLVKYEGRMFNYYLTAVE